MFSILLRTCSEHLDHGGDFCSIRPALSKGNGWGLSKLAHCEKPSTWCYSRVNTTHGVMGEEMLLQQQHDSDTILVISVILSELPLSLSSVFLAFWSSSIFFLPILERCFPFLPFHLSLSFISTLLLLSSLYLYWHLQFHFPLFMLCCFLLGFPSISLFFLFLWSFTRMHVHWCKCMFQLSCVSLHKSILTLQTAA